MLDSSSESEFEKIAELKRQINQLRQRQEHFQQITDNIKEVFFLIDSNTDGIFYVSPAYEKVWGRSCESLYEDPQSWLLAIHPDDCSQAMGSLETQFRTGEEFQEEYRIIRPDGSICWVRVKAFPIRNEQDKVNRFVGIAEDITKRKETEIALKQSEEHFKLIFEQASIGIAVTDLSGKFEKINPAFCDILEYMESDLLDTTLLDILQSDYVSSHESIIDNLLRSSLSEVQLEVQCKTRTHKIIDVILKAVVIYDDLEEPINFQFQLLDISDRKKMERQLVYDALHDPLTQLPNRVLFTDRLEQAIARHRVHAEYRYAVLFLDIDRFKVVNDGLGHLSGDQLLILVAQRLRKELKKTDTIARFGGDEFTILLDDIADYDVATEVADRLQKVLRDYFEIEGNRVFVSASIGITLSNNAYEKAEDVIRDADATMYKAKDRGRARYEVFDRSLRAAAMGRLNLETEVRLGISRNEFRLFYQPIIDINTSETFTLRGFEALVRWQHPKQGLIGPHLLIPVAEETGLIVELGEMIFDMACLQLMEWQQSKFDISNLKLSINLSGKQLMSPDLLSMIKRRISRSNVDPQKIKLEITESILLEQDYQAIHILNNLRDFGFEISLDDFGTGYSSLSYLQRLPIDTLKIDRSFIQKIQNDVKHKNFAIVQAIITLSHALGLNVIAEGVETKEQLEKLQFLQCEYVQGYLFAPPVDVVAATEFLKARIIEI
jgi:diguanylate cyclase (GGDEF)-like protein/PAS domain S-box-containing protein